MREVTRREMNGHLEQRKLEEVAPGEEGEGMTVTGEE